MDRALYELAEAALGKNSEMQWSLNTAILRRQVAPVFDRCVEGVLTPEDALDITLDFVGAGISNNIDVLDHLFATLNRKVHYCFPDTAFPALAQLQELFMGLSNESVWATSDVVTRRELHPLFVRVSTGRTTKTDGLVTFCDHIRSKREYYLELVQQLTFRLTQEILEANHLKEKTTNGDTSA